jgi:hypothetical protein
MQNINKNLRFSLCGIPLMINCLYCVGGFTARWEISTARWEKIFHCAGTCHWHVPAYERNGRCHTFYILKLKRKFLHFKSFSAKLHFISWDYPFNKGLNVLPGSFECGEFILQWYMLYNAISAQFLCSVRKMYFMLYFDGWINQKTRGP